MLEFELTPDRRLGPCMDVCAFGGCFYAVQNGAQFPGGRICKIAPDGSVADEYIDIGSARQIAVQDGIAAVSARENGLWLFDLCGESIRPLVHYQTVEYATGIALWNHFALVSCRQYGVEIVDIADARHPRFISLIRIGEVQSACVVRDVLYCGVWGAMNVAVVDLRDIRAPRLLTRLPLQGRGDGLTASGGYLYAAIGQHRRGIQNLSDPDDPCFGCGNGLEVFDIRDVSNIKHLRTIYTGRAYISSFDTWRVYAFEKCIVVTNSWLGYFAFRKDTLELIEHACSKTAPYYDAIIDQTVDSDPIVGIAQAGDRIAVATGRGGLAICENRFGNLESAPAARSIPVEPAPYFSSSSALRVLFSCGGLVSDVCAADGRLAIAAGSCGICILDGDGRLVQSRPTDGFCQNVKFARGFLFSAESECGLAIYSCAGGRIEPVVRIRDSLPALQVILDSTERYAIVCLGSTTVKVYDAIDPAQPIEVARREARFGPIYGESFAFHALSDGSTAMFWHRDGLIRFNAHANPMLSEHFIPKRNGFMGFGPENGIDCRGDRAYYNLDGGLIELPTSGDVCADDLPLFKGDGFIGGKFTFFGRYVVSTERAGGVVAVTDISNPESPVEALRIHTSASPCRPTVIGGRVYIPGGHAGLLTLDIQ